MATIQWERRKGCLVKRKRWNWMNRWHSHCRYIDLFDAVDM